MSSRIRGGFGFAWALLLVMLMPAVGLATDPNLASVNDILNGRRTLVSVDDLVIADPVWKSNTQTLVLNEMLTTENGSITSSFTDQVLSAPCGVDTTEEFPGASEAFPQQTRVMRLYNQKYDNVVTVTASANASGDGCKGSNNLLLSAYDFLQKKVVASATRSLPSLDWLVTAAADFDFDGLDDILVMNGAQAFVATGNSSASFTFGPTIETGSTLTPLGEPAVGDLNGDGILDVAWPGATIATGSFVSVHFASICPGSVPGTICNGAARFAIVLSPQSITYSNANLTWSPADSESVIPLFALAAGNFVGATGRDELLVAHQQIGGFPVLTDYQFDDNLVPTELSQAGLITSSESQNGFVGHARGLYATGAALNWNGGTDQAVVGLSFGYQPSDLNDAFVVRTRIDAITFDGSGAMTVHAGANQDNTGLQVLRGVAVGGFSTLPESPQASDFNPQIAALLSAVPLGDETTTVTQANNRFYIYTLQAASGNYTPSITSQYTPTFGYNATAIGIDSWNTAGSLLRAGDLQGRSVRVGSPLVLRESSHTQPFVVLGAPPSHVDYVQVADETAKTAAVVNFSALPDSYASQFSAETQNQSQSANVQTTSYTHATMQSSEAGLQFGLPVVDGVSGTVSSSTENAYTNEVSSEYDTYATSSFDISAATRADDNLWFTSTQFNMYYYPVIGQFVCPSDNPSCSESEKVPLMVVFSGPQETRTETVSGALLEWYQPVEEPLQVFSYPWSYQQLALRVPQTQLLSQPLSFYTDTSDVTQSVQWSTSQGNTQTSGTTSTHSSDTSRSITLGSPDLSQIDGSLGGNASTSVSYADSSSISTLNTDVTIAGASSGIEISKPGTFLSPGLYAYSVSPYILGQTATQGTVQQIPTGTDVTTTGVLQAAYVADPTDLNAGSWWSSGQYTRYVDIALNHPDRWQINVSPPSLGTGPECLFTNSDSTDLACARFNDPDSSDLWNSEFYWMRGLMVTVGGPTGPQRTQATAGDSVFLTARVYNYSLTAMPAGATVHVRFYRQPWDTSSQTPIGDSVLIAENVVNAIASFNSTSDPTAPNWVLTSASFDSSALAGQSMVFWTVVWAEDASGKLLNELPGHGLASIPASLASIAEVPLEMTTYTYQGRVQTTSFSNNVGFLKLPFFVAPAAPSEGLQASRRSVHEPGDLVVDKLDAMPIVARLGEKVAVRADVSSRAGDRDGLVVTLYDGNPDTGGKAFDMELLGYVKANQAYRVRVPYRAQTCGEHDLVVIANRGKPDEARRTIALTAVCDPPATATAVPTQTPTAPSAGDSADGCAIDANPSDRMALILLLPLLLSGAARRRRCYPRR